MTDIALTIRVNVDLTNPGQFFACCGLLELADRLWPGADEWFASRGGVAASSLVADGEWGSTQHWHCFCSATDIAWQKLWVYDRSTF